MGQYEDFKNIYSLINVDLNSYKEKQMKRRITSLAKRNGFDSLNEYYLKLKTDKELLINLLTISLLMFLNSIETRPNGKY